MMKKKLYWIDDTHDAGKPPSLPAQKRLEDGLKLKLEIKKIVDRKQFDELLPQLGDAGVCGVIMDYQLTKVGEKGQMAYGNTWAAEIRAAHYHVPVIGISHERVEKIPRLRLESFLAFFPRDLLMGHNPPFKDLTALLNGYRNVCKLFDEKGNKSGADRIVGLAKPPKAQADLFRAAVPTSLRAEWDKETPHIVSRWLWHELQGRPGFLFDELGLATFLGLNPAGVSRVCKQFAPARYQGCFASDERPRWWVSAIRPIAEGIVGDQIVGPISNGREKLLNALNVKQAEMGGLLSRPYGGRGTGDIPECVAYRDDQREDGDRVQVLLKDTYVDDRDANPPFGFEARRIFRKSQPK